MLVAAGIQPFQGTGGIYNKCVGGVKTEELFIYTVTHYRWECHFFFIPIPRFHVTQRSNTRETFRKFMAEMLPQRLQGYLLIYISCWSRWTNRHTLLRIYTQNINSLELKAGLSNCSAYGIHDQNVVCVSLHGHLHQMCCQSCSSTFSLDAFHGTLTAWELPRCDHLQLRDRKTASFWGLTSFSMGKIAL